MIPMLEPIKKSTALITAAIAPVRGATHNNFFEMIFTGVLMLSVV
jgi:hypothetical protein